MTNGPGLTAELPRSLARRRPRIAVVGDAILDGWLSGHCSRLAREAPAPVVDVTGQSYAPGGAANTAANLAALGAEVRMVTAVGADEAGDMLVDRLRRAGVGTGYLVRIPGRTTITKRRVVAGDQLVVRFDDGDKGMLDRADDECLASALRDATEDCAAVLVCDYATGILGPEVLAALRDVRPRVPLLVVDSHDPRCRRDLRPDLVTPNAEEASGLLGVALPAAADERVSLLERKADELRAAAGAGTVVVTLDRDGAVLLAPGQPAHRTWARPVADNHTAGAGDTFVAALTLAAAAGHPVTTAIELAQAAADVVVHRPGTAVCSSAELSERIGSYHGSALGHDELARLVAGHRAAGRRVVFTNGCFDVLHRGHVAYLNQAKRLGDVLVVALNSDESVRRLKGPQRPVNTASDRAAVLAALSCVDHVAVFEEDTPAALLERLRPDVYAKGGDYTPEMLPETPVVRAYGGEVRLLDYVPDHSTTAVIDRIRTNQGVPAGERR